MFWTHPYTHTQNLDRCYTNEEEQFFLHISGFCDSSMRAIEKSMVFLQTEKPWWNIRYFQGINVELIWGNLSCWNFERSGYLYKAHALSLQKSAISDKVGKKSRFFHFLI